MSVRLLDVPFQPGAEIDQFTKIITGQGAVVNFLGTVRDKATGETVEGVTGLHLEHHPVLTQAGIEAALAKAKAKWSLLGALIIHRIGDIGVDEPIVLVCTASAHRRAAFQATDFLMDYLKTEAVFWKKEYRTTGSAWIEPRAADYHDANRWDLENT